MFDFIEIIMIIFYLFSCFKCTYNTFCGKNYGFLDTAFPVITVMTLKPNRSLLESIIENLNGAVAKIVILPV